MNKARKKRIKRNKRVAAAYKKANALPRKRVVRMRTPLSRLRLTHDKALELRKTIKQNARKRRQLAKKQETDGPVEITDN